MTTDLTPEEIEAKMKAIEGNCQAFRDAGVSLQESILPVRIKAALEEIFTQAEFLLALSRQFQREKQEEREKGWDEGHRAGLLDIKGGEQIVRLIEEGRIKAANPHRV